MIGLDVVVDGSVNLKNGIIVYGQIKGSVNTKGPVRLAKNAIVKGDIVGSDIRIAGIVEGDISSIGQVTLLKTCKVKGDITYKKLVIEDGAKFEGKCELAMENSNIIIAENFFDSFKVIKKNTLVAYTKQIILQFIKLIQLWGLTFQLQNMF